MENKKYELLKEESINVYDITLYRIKALKDFNNVKAGDLGGYIEKEENLSHEGNCWVSGNARVYGNAYVYDNARVFGDARVYGNAEVFGNAIVYGNAYVSSNNDYCTIHGFGSENRVTTFFRNKVDDKYEIYVKCGCFEGNLEEFRQKVIERHGHTLLAEEYLCVADLIEKRFKNRKVLGE